MVALTLAFLTVSGAGITVRAGTPEAQAVGEGISWPSQVFAPYVDMVAWVPPGRPYSNNGAPNLSRIAEYSGAEFFKLGFIQAVTGQNGQGRVENGRVVWGWGGHEVLSPLHPNNAQYRGIRQAIYDVRKMGGDVAISIGGLYGITPWEVSQDVDVLVATYLDIINAYNLTRLDLDIETATSTVESLNIINARAIRQVQYETGIEVVLTLPVLPSGLTPRDQAVLRAYLSEGVDVLMVNIMTMAYGHATIPPGHNYGTASLLAVENTMRQVRSFFYRYADIELTEEEAFARVGTTISIGFEGTAHPIFTLEWAELVVEHAIEKGLGLASFWSMNRDAMIEWAPNPGIHAPYEFSYLFNRFADAVKSEEDVKDDEDIEEYEDDDETQDDDDKDDEDEDEDDDDDEKEEPDEAPAPPVVLPPAPVPPAETTPPRAPTPPSGDIIDFSNIPGTTYTMGQLVRWNGEVFRVRQTFTYWGDPSWKPGGPAHSLWQRVA